MSWVKIIYIVQTNWSWKQSSTVRLCIVLNSQSNEQKPAAFLFRTIHDYWNFTPHLNRINKPGKFKTNQAWWIMQRGVLWAWHDQLFQKGKKTGQFFPILCDLFDYIKSRTKENRAWAASCSTSHTSKALMVPYGDKDKTRARMWIQH